MSNKLPGAFQENLATLVCFDPNAAGIIRNSVSLNMFESSVLRDIVSVAYDYYDRYQKPIADHLADEFEDIINDRKERRKAEYYEEVIGNIYSLSETIEAKYVLDKLEAFARQQSLKAGITGAVEAINNEDLDEAEKILGEALNKQLVTFQAGTFMSDISSLTAAMNDDAEHLPIGIPELERYGVTPVKGEVLLYIAPPKSGKTWFSMHCAKMGVIHRWRTLVITLEMPEKKYHKRLMQTFFSISKRAGEKYSTVKFDKNEYGHFVEFDQNAVEERPSFQDDNIVETMSKMIARIQKRAPLLIKHFPSGTLSVKNLVAYLDSLERLYNYVPELLIVDYPDIMKLNNPANKRTELDKIYVDLRGIATARNLAMVLPTQSSKEAKFAKQTTGEHASEAYSKKHHADTVLTYSQTREEKNVGLARLYVDAARYDRDGFEVAISQCYALGQFCLDSAEINQEYWAELDTEAETEE